MDKVDVSVVIPTRWDRKTTNLLKYMWKSTNKKNWEMIIVFDDFPVDHPDILPPDELLYAELVETFRDNPNVKILRSADSKYKFDYYEKKFRTAGALNWGVEHTIGKYLFITYSDFFLTPLWLEALLKLSEQFDMKKTVINPVHLEDFLICDKNADVKKLMWTQPYETASKRCFFSETTMEKGISELELIEYWNKTKSNTLVEEKDCNGLLGNSAPLFMLKELWTSIGGQKLNGDHSGERAFHDELKAMKITKIIPKNIYAFNVSLPNKWEEKGYD